MYKLPNDFDTTVFIGRDLETLTFSENTISLDFGGDDRLLVIAEGGITYEYLDNNGTRATLREEVKPSETSLVRLIGKKVISATVKDQACLLLQFANDDTVWFDGSSQQYEMYRIIIGSHELIV